MVLRVLLTVVLALGVASAQRGGSKGGGGGAGGMGGGMGMGMQRQTRIDVIGDKLKLSKEQKEEISKIFDAAQMQAASINEQIKNGRNKITGVIVEGKNSGEEWNGLMKAYSNILAQEAAVEADAFQKMYATLEDKQKPKAGQVFEEQMAGMFEGRNWRMMGGGRGGR